MKSLSPFIIFLLFIIPEIAFSQFTLPFFEDFSESICDPLEDGCAGPNPDGWIFPLSDPGNQITWRAGEQGFIGHVIGDPPPAAYFYYTPTYLNYEHRLKSPTIYVGSAEQVQVSFWMELDFWEEAELDGTEGLSIEYRTPGENWVQVLGYEIAPNINVNFEGRVDSYIADVTDSIQLGFRAYGDNSFNINSWDIDNVTVTPVPQLTFVSIRSNNPLDSTLAVPGHTITLKYTADAYLIETNAIIAGGGAGDVNIDSVSGSGGTEWQATYVVDSLDADGPVSFVAMFQARYYAGGTPVKTDGNPKTTTTDNSLVVIDRTGPGEFELGAVNTFEALETDTIWYSNDDSLRMLVNIPPDTAIVKFLYESGTSLSFDTDEFVTIDVSGNPLQPATDSLTVEAWIKPDSTYLNYDGFLSYADLPADSSDWKGYAWFYFGSGWHFFLRTDNPAPNEWADATGNEWPVAAVQTGEWTHLAATYDKEYLITYRNGIPTDTTIASGNIQYSASTDLLISKFVFDSDVGFFDGKIDEVRIWDVPRTKEQIQGYMNQSLSGNEPGLIGYWRFDEGTGTTVIDASGQGNNGTIPSASLWDTNDSPIDFKEDSLAFDQLVGAYAQLTDSTFGNQPLNIGNLSILTQEDITAGQRMVTAMDAEYEAVTGIIDSSTHIIGARILDQAGNFKHGNNPKRITVDNRSPGIDTAYIHNIENMIINFSEGLFQSDNGTGAVQKTEFQLYFEQNENNGGTANIVPVGSDSLLSISKVFTGDLVGGERDIRFYFAVDTVASGDETVEITVQNSTIFDQYGNQMLTTVTTDPIFLNDLIAPYVENSTIDTSNAFVEIIFNESVYSAVSASIDPAHFDSVLFVFDVGDHATNVSITGVTKNDGSPLVGGEDTIHVNLDVTGAPSGTETITIRPILNKIKDRGTPPNFLTDSSGILYLYKYPWIDSVESVNNLDENNAFVEIIFSDTVFSGSGGALTSSDFSGLNFQLGADGNAEAAAIADITNTNNIVLNTGEDTIRVYLDITGIPSGTETIKIGPLNDTSIVNSISNPLDESDTLLFTLKDKLLPTIDSAYVDSTNAFIDFSASEGLWTNPEHSLPLIPQDFELGFTQNFNMGGTVTGASIDSLTKQEGGSLDGGENRIKIYLDLDFDPGDQFASGDEQILVKVTDGTSIYDRNGNPMDSGASTDSLTLHDKLPPSIDSLRIINSNEYANLYFSEGIYDSFPDPIGIGVFDDTFIPGLGGHATNVSIDSVRKNDGSPLEGGEKTIRIYLDVTDAPSGTEIIELKPLDDTSIEDFSGNPMDTAATITDLLNKEPWIKVNNSNKRIMNLDENNAFVEIVFSDTVFNSSGGALTSSDFSGLDFQQGAGGNATAAAIANITNTNDIVLNTGEDTIRVYLNITGIPSGYETIKIGPLSDSSIVNSISNPLDESDTLLTLKDKLLPTIDSAYVDSTNDFILFYASEGLWTDEEEDEEYDDPVFVEDFELGFTQNFNMGGTVTGATIAELTKEDGVSDLTGGEKRIKIYLDLYPPGQLASGDEQILVKVKNGTSIYDRNGNPMDSGARTDSLSLHDKLPPGIDSLRIINSNEYANLYFSEGIYNSSSDSIGIGVFGDLTFLPGNDPGATGVQIDSLRKSNGNPLTGGETQIRVYLTVSGTPSGTESIGIEPQDSSIKDLSNNYMGTIATGRDSLNSFPRIIDSTLSDENSYVQLILSEEIFNLSNGPLSSSDFIIDEFVQGDSGNAEDAIISSITDVNNNLLTTGEDTIRLVINLMNPPASGVETIKIRPLTDFSIINEIGNALEISQSSRTFLLNDRFPPYIYPNTTLINDTINVPPHTYYYLVIQTNEKIYTDTLNNEGISKVEISDFHLEFYNNGGNATNAFITDITDTLGHPLDPSGGHSIIWVHFSLFGALPSGVEEVEISPNSPASIYDESANPMLRTSTSGKVLLPDRLPPKINLPTADIPDDNSYVIITLTEDVYGDASATTPVDENDFFVEFMTDSIYATGAEVSGILNSLQNPLVGGEDTLYCYLEFVGTPAGAETFYIKAADANSVFDANGNALEFSPNSWEVDQNTDTLRLNDQVVPEILPHLSTPNDTTISSSIGLPIKLVFNEPVQSFSYSISARHYNYLTYSDTTTATTFKLNLHPPLASLDTITLTISNLTDSVGNTAVNLGQTYFTPALGDYDIDDRVNVEDLAQFVSFWMADSQPLVLGLGPTSGTFPHLVPNLDDKYDLDDGMTFIRMWSWSVDRFGLEPSASPPIGIAMNWDKLVVDVPTEAIAGQVYLRYNPLQGKVDLHHTGFGNNNLTMKREAIENGEILLEFGLVDPDDDARVISIKTEINEPADATVIYKFFAEDQSLIAAGTQKIALVIPTEFRLMQNYPNPFNNTTIIPYAVPEETFVKLEIFDINGRHVETLTSQFHQPGFHTLHWSGRRAASGVYFIKLQAAKTVLTQKMILLK